MRGRREEGEVEGLEEEVGVQDGGTEFGEVGVARAEGGFGVGRVGGEAGGGGIRLVSLRVVGP